MALPLTLQAFLEKEFVTGNSGHAIPEPLSDSGPDNQIQQLETVIEESPLLVSELIDRISNLRKHLAASALWMCFTFLQTPAQAEDASSAPGVQTPDAAKAELIADLKAIVAHGNLQDEKFIADLFKIEMVPTLWSNSEGETVIGFKIISKSIYSFIYRTEFGEKLFDEPNMSDASLSIGINGKICLKVSDLDWWSVNPPRKGGVLDSTASTAQYDAKATSAVHNLSLNVSYGRVLGNCIDDLEIVQNLSPALNQLYKGK